MMGGHRILREADWSVFSNLKVVAVSMNLIQPLSPHARRSADKPYIWISHRTIKFLTKLRSRNKANQKTILIRIDEWESRISISGMLRS